MEQEIDLVNADDSKSLCEDTDPFIIKRFILVIKIFQYF